MSGIHAKPLLFPFLFLVLAALAGPFSAAEEPAALLASLEPPSPSSYGKFGQSVAVYGGLVLVAAPKSALGEIASAGAAYLFGPEGRLVASLRSPQPRKDSSFGGFYMSEKGVGIGPGWLLVQEAMDKSAGAVHLFDSSGNFGLSLQCPDRARFERAFGQAIAMDGDRALLGGFAGGAYLYSSEGLLIQSLKNADAINSWGYGRAVALSGDCAVVTDLCATVAGKAGAGRALVYDRNGVLKSVIPSPDPEAAPANWIMPGVFGNAAATNGSLIAVAASRAAEPDGKRPGRVYLFDAKGVLAALIKAPEGAFNFGSSLAMNDRVIAVGADQSQVGEVKAAGLVYLFDLAGGPLGVLAAPIPSPAGIFGASVALQGEYLVVGEPGAASGGFEGSGRTHVFRLSAGLASPAK